MLGRGQGDAAARLLVGARQVFELTQLTQGLDAIPLGRAATGVSVPSYAGPQPPERRLERLGAEGRAELGLGTGEVLR